MIRVVIADDHPLMREGVKSLLARTSDTEIVGEATNSSEVLAAVRKLKIDVLILDLNMPGLSGAEVMQRMRGDPRTFFVPVVILTSEPKYSPIVKEIQGGLNSYVRKPLHFRDFQEKLEQVREYWRTSNFGPLKS